MKTSIFFILFGCLCWAADPSILRFSDFLTDNSIEDSSLWNVQGQIIQVRGFWYPLSFQEGILAPQPHLKSCCLKVPDQIHQQLFVKGIVHSLPFQRAVTLEGIFKIEPRYNAEGQLIQLFILEHAREISQSTMYLSGMTLFVFFFLLAFGIFFLRKMKSQSTTALHKKKRNLS